MIVNVDNFLLIFKSTDMDSAAKLNAESAAVNKPEEAISLVIWSICYK